MICTYGADGIKRVALSQHPSVPEVEYLVGWQIDDTECPIPEELNRHDFKIFRHATKGLSRNRNYLLSKATAPILLISDDDVDYTPLQLKSVINAFDSNPEYDIITFRYDSTKSKKRYPNHSFYLWNAPKGYYTTSFEIGIRNKYYLSTLKFNESFGIGSGIFIAGEEDIFLHDCKKKKLKGIFIPITICTHTGDTTSERNLYNPLYIQTKGAVFIHIHPFTWPLRMVAHALREKNFIPLHKYISNWIKGALISFVKN